MCARTMKPKIATTRMRDSFDSFARPPISIAYPKGVIPAKTPRGCAHLRVVSQPVALRRVNIISLVIMVVGRAIKRQPTKYTFLISALLNLEPPDPDAITE